MKIVIGALALIVLAVNITHANPIKDATIKDYLVTTFNEALTATNELINQLNDDLDSVLVNRDELTDDLQGFIIKSAELVSGAFFGLLQDLTVNATVDGQAVIRCIAAEQNKTNSLIEDSAVNATSCIAVQIGFFLPRLQTIVLQLDFIQFTVQNDVDDLDACVEEEVSCLTTFFEALESTAQDALGSFKSDIENIIATIEQIENNVKQCRGKEQFVEGVQEVFDEAVVCIMA